MTRALLSLAALVFVLYGLVCAVMFTWQRSLLYFPQPRQAGAAVPSLLLDSGGERLVITTGRTDQADAVLYFGGNAEDVSATLPALTRAFPGHAL